MLIREEWHGFLLCTRVETREIAEKALLYFSMVLAGTGKKREGFSGKDCQMW